MLKAKAKVRVFLARFSARLSEVAGDEGWPRLVKACCEPEAARNRFRRPRKSYQASRHLGFRV